ncbi:conserved unknown protein [Ectocarpus siliculosus]|uniref:SAP30-binding protein n=1 Tax=Ectocarpus siliculosus TaxID=2880 RepID=D7G7V8_ECTSI|nr:conserved unknown protein [Ectocarpus siliculosus]|eukprot:CBJ27839.1 conserved unknown protein [Ectocarpus siliculosus]
MSLLGLAGYDTDGSDGDEGANNNQRRSPQAENTSGAQEPAAGASGSSNANNALEENSDSRLGESVDEEAGANRELRTGILRASSFDAPAPPSKESRQFFMPLPSPLVKLDNASPSASSPFITYEPPDGTAGGAGAEGEGEGAADDGAKDEGDGDIIKPEYRDMLPPEATGQANPELRAKLQKFLNRMQGDFTKVIKGKKDYGNPAVLAQICRYCSVDDKGTNYPADRMVHPSVYDTKDFHDSLMMQEQRRAKRPKPDEAKAKAAAVAQGAAAVAAAAAAAAPRPAAATGARGSVDAAVPAASGSTRKRGSKWGVAGSSLPFAGQQMQMQAAAPVPMPHMQVAAATAAAAAATAAAAAAAGSGMARAGSVGAGAAAPVSKGRVGFSADPGATAARAGQAALLLNAQVQAAQAEKEAQHRAEAIARVQMIANRAGKAASASTQEPPKKQQRLN